jgi:hypothetical protein
MNQVEQLIRKYQLIHKALGIEGDTNNSARRTTKPNTDKKPPANPPAPSPTFTYPPPTFSWNAMIKWLKANTEACPGCYHRKSSFHRKYGCLPLARAGFVLKYDPVGSKEIIASHDKAEKQQKAKQREEAKRATEEKESAEEKEDGSQASAKRASAKRTGRTNIFDAFLSQDSSDEGEHELDERHGVDDKNNSNSAPYHLCNTNFSAAKSEVVASARHVSTSLAEAAKVALASPHSKVSSCNTSHQECCADSGATEHMLNDYDAFVSYHPCRNEYVTLGDDTKLKIYGRGSARFMLNGRVIQVRNALHVPDLRAPLYSLRRHRSPSYGWMWLLFSVQCWVFHPVSHFHD